MGTEGTLNRLPESAQWIWIVRRLFFTVRAYGSKGTRYYLEVEVVSQYEVLIANMEHSTVRCQ